jgi:hypothetical protein
MSDIQLETDEVTEILNTYCRQEALGRDGAYSMGLGRNSTRDFWLSLRLT